MPFLLKLEKIINRITDFVGALTILAMVLMIVNVFYDVISRYFFRSNSIALQELEWHLFSVIILLGVAYTLKEDGHVRVDIIYDKLSETKKALINMFGAIIFILPIAILVGISSIDNVREAYLSMEQSGNPGGLQYRWIVKSLIPLSFLMLIISTIGFFIKNLNIYVKYKSLKSSHITPSEQNGDLT
ncbi:MAG: TRAP transporter small permease subunit [Gammaproteobacteria bacterium]|nr:TRAP transporter small permease subunit [Gammaproteobacteria bacterium]